MNGFRLTALATALVASPGASADTSLFSPLGFVPLGPDVLDITSVAVSNAGPYVVVGQRTNGAIANVIFQRYDTNGVKAGAEQHVAAGAGDRSAGQIAMEPDGDFIVTWENASGNPGRGIYARRYTAGGVAKGDALQVSPAGHEPRIVAGPAGDFAIAWHTLSAQGTPVFVRAYDGDGAPRTAAIEVPTNIVSLPAYDVAMSADGDFAVAFEGYGAHSTAYIGEGIFLRRFEADGTPKTLHERLVGQDPNALTHDPTLAATYDGNLFVAWSRDARSPGGNSAIFGQCLDPNGVARGDVFRVSQYAYGQRSVPSADAEDGEDFLVAWQATGQSPNGAGIFGRRIRVQECRPRQGEFFVSPVAGVDQVRPMVSMASSGGALIGWNAEGAAGMAQHYSPHANSRPTVGFESATEDVAEGGSTLIHVRLSAPQTHPVTFDIVAGGTANAPSDGAGIDYRVSGDGIVDLGDRRWRWTIPAGATRAGLKLKALSDNRNDPGEYILLDIDLESFPALAPGPGQKHAVGIF